MVDVQEQAKSASSREPSSRPRLTDGPKPMASLAGRQNRQPVADLCSRVRWQLRIPEDISAGQQSLLLSRHLTSTAQTPDQHQKQVPGYCGEQDKHAEIFCASPDRPETIQTLSDRDVPT